MLPYGTTDAFNTIEWSMTHRHSKRLHWLWWFMGKVDSYFIYSREPRKSAKHTKEEDEKKNTHTTENKHCESSSLNYRVYYGDCATKLIIYDTPFTTTISYASRQMPFSYPIYLFHCWFATTPEIECIWTHTHTWPHTTLYYDRVETITKGSIHSCHSTKMWNEHHTKKIWDKCRMLARESFILRTRTCTQIHVDTHASKSISSAMTSD